MAFIHKLISTGAWQVPIATKSLLKPSFLSTYFHMKIRSMPSFWIPRSARKVGNALQLLHETCPDVGNCSNAVSENRTYISKFSSEISKAHKSIGLTLEEQRIVHMISCISLPVERCKVCSFLQCQEVEENCRCCPWSKHPLVHSARFESKIQWPHWLSANLSKLTFDPSARFCSFTVPEQHFWW